MTHVQLVDADGNLVGTQATRDVVYSTIFGAPHPTVVPLADGGFVIDWRGIVEIDNVDQFRVSDVFQAYDASGNAVGGISQFAAQTEFGPRLVRVFALPQGGFAADLVGAGFVNNLLIYDNNGNFVGDVRMADAGDGAVASQMFLTNLANGTSLILYDEENGTLTSSRATVQTIKFDTATPVIQTGVTFNENTTGTIPVVISIPDPDGSEIVQEIDIAGIPAGWTLSDPGGTASYSIDGNFWVVGGNVTHGGEIDLSLKPPVNFVGSEALTVTVPVVDTGNGSLNQSIPLTFDVTVLAVPDDFDGDGTSDVLFNTSTTGDTGYWAINSSGNVGKWVDLGVENTSYDLVGSGDFLGNGIADVLWWNSQTGDTGFWSISNGAVSGWHDLGTAGGGYTVAAVGDFLNAGTSDVLWFNSATGDTGFWSINNGIVSGWQDLGTAGSGYNVAGTGDFYGSGTDDVLWFNSATRDTGFWSINNGTVSGWQDLGTPGSGYNVAGTGHFYGSGTDDVLWSNSATGDVGFWSINNGSVAGWQDLGVAASGYSVVAVGDYLGNGTSDVLFQNTATGDTGYWAISNGAVTGWHDLGNAGAGYSIHS